MKATGIVRKVDELGRIEIFVDDDYIMLKKYEPACIFCGNAKDIHLIHGKNVCSSCINELRKTKG